MNGKFTDTFISNNLPKSAKLNKTTNSRNLGTVQFNTQMMPRTGKETMVDHRSSGPKSVKRT